MNFPTLPADPSLVAHQPPAIILTGSYNNALTEKLLRAD